MKVFLGWIKYEHVWKQAVDRADEDTRGAHRGGCLVEKTEWNRLMWHVEKAVCEILGIEKQK